MESVIEIFVKGFGILVGAGFLWFVYRIWTGKKKVDAETDAMICPECGYDMRASPTRCPECGAIAFNRREYLRRLREDWPDAPIEPRRPEPGEQLVLMLSTDDAREVQLLHDQFQSRGLACLIQESNMREQFVGGITQTTTFRRLMVYESDVELAKEYLYRFRGVPPQMLDEVKQIERLKESAQESA